MDQKLNFRNGYAYFGGLQIYTGFTNYFLIFFDYILNKYSKTECLKIFRDSSLIDSNILYKKLKREFSNNSMIIKKFLEIISNFGFGEVRMNYCSKNKFIFQLKYHFVSNYYSKLFEKCPKIYIEEFLFGFVINFISLMFGKKFDVLITESNNSLFLQLEITDEIFEFNSSEDYPEVPKSHLSQHLKQILLNKGFKVKNGNLKILNLNFFLLPYFSFFSFLKCFNSNIDLEFLRDLGLSRASSVINFHKNHNRGTPEEVLVRILNLSDISGIGSFTISKKNHNLVYFDTKLISHYSDFFSENEIFNLKFHIFSFCRGIYEFNFNKTYKLDAFSNKFLMTPLENNRSNSKIEDKMCDIMSINRLIDNFF